MSLSNILFIVPKQSMVTRKRGSVALASRSPKEALALEKTSVKMDLNEDLRLASVCSKGVVSDMPEFAPFFPSMVPLML
eukprot:CAMPEP_0184356826 /NCGR_PEP_ID=MMETSP1089-20130417/105260_1 /TAXON_ID=38269 ORGANISM="Gloeochaete wittrockiana, Strain SAG46.84" /NCGR_SAMPLE_ID=MMETSP1089 /ASSEMBLY_ACC=CAM_ASM_000445 /LENGTH=78 /DNA_ID=CAMNT_0026694271 /DNA_START=338 /DNA_END=574 /DNA_ORIENTATION=-